MTRAGCVGQRPFRSYEYVLYLVDHSRAISLYRYRKGAGEWPDCVSLYRIQMRIFAEVSGALFRSIPGILHIRDADDITQRSRP